MRVSQGFRLALAVAGAVAAWILGAPHWSDLLTTQAVGGLLAQVVVTVAAAYGVNFAGGGGRAGTVDDLK